MCVDVANVWWNAIYFTGVGGTSVDNQTPVTKEDFQQFEKSLTDKICLFSSSEHYPDFIVNLVRKISVDLNAKTLKEVMISCNTSSNIIVKICDPNLQITQY